MEPRHVLVTGGAGFIGSHLCQRLLAHGHRVTCLDDLSTSTGHSLAALSTHPQFRFIKGDVTEPIHVNVDRIFHLACPASPIHYQQDPVRTLMTAVLGTKSVLDLAQSCGARILTTSTSEVYGDPALHPQRENYWGNVNPIGPRACYNEGKRAAETLAVDYARQHGVAVKIVRLFNTYGPGMAVGDGRVVPSFIRDALAGDPLRIHGDGLQTRSFCYVSDVVEALSRMMETPAPTVGPVNIGNPQEITMRDLAELIRRMTDSRSPIISMDRPQDDPERRRPDIDLAHALLDWAPTTDLETGISLTIDYFKQTRAISEGPS